MKLIFRFHHDNLLIFARRSHSQKLRLLFLSSRIDFSKVDQKLTFWPYFIRKTSQKVGFWSTFEKSILNDKKSNLSFWGCDRRAKIRRLSWWNLNINFIGFLNCKNRKTLEKVPKNTKKALFILFVHFGKKVFEIYSKTIVIDYNHLFWINILI